MRIRTIALLVTLGAASWACGGTSEPEAEPSGGAEGAARSVADLVDRERVDSCAGFDAAQAADLLGVPAADLEVRTEFVSELGGQLCRYWSAESLLGPGIQFLMEAEESGTAASVRLARLRGDVPAGDAAIRGATGRSATGPSLMEFDGIGDEAFWDALTGGVSVRVRNVLATIQASSARQALSDREPAQIELERRVAELVARGLNE